MIAIRIPILVRHFSLLTICFRIFLSGTHANAEMTLRFDKHAIDTAFGEACAFGDFNKDGVDDIACGTTWYAAPTWSKHVFRASAPDDDYMDAMDVDGDGWVDVIFGKFSDGFWLKNPGNVAGLWQTMGSLNIGSCHSGGLWDIDGDGKKREVLGAGADASTIWSEFVGGAWVPHVISTTKTNWGSGVGDINGDGHPDIVRPDGWFEGPVDPRSANWVFHPIAIGAIEEQPNSIIQAQHFDHPLWERNNAIGICGHTVQIYVIDVDGDGLNDLISSSGHRMGIMWNRQIRSSAGVITFQPEVIDGSISEVHTLEMVDMDKDGDLDLVAGKRWRGHAANEDPLSEAPLYVFWYEKIKTRPYFKRHTLSYGENIGAGTKIGIGDYDHDGDIDVVVSAKRQEGKGGGPFLFENKYPLTIADSTPGPGAQIAWVKHKIDVQTAITCAFADVDKDGKLDLVSGDNWYKAPLWTKHPFRTLAAGADGLGEMLDVDGDTWPDVITGGYGKGLTWYKNPGTTVGTQSANWTSEVIDSAGNYENGDLWDVDGDGKAQEIVSASYLPGVKWWEVVSGKWVSHTISTLSCDFGVGVGDVNKDGRPDIIRPNAWFEAPVDPRNGVWIVHEIALGAIDDRSMLLGTGSMKSPKWMSSNTKGMYGHTAQIRVYDVNKDGKNDIICSSAHRVGIFWYEQKTPDLFERHNIDATWSQAHALEFKDMDGDGDPDLVTGKAFHAQVGDPQPENALQVVWYELIPGASEPWIKHEISYNEGIGAGYNIAIADYDADGDMDLAVAGASGGPWIFENMTKSVGIRNIENGFGPNRAERPGLYQKVGGSGILVDGLPSGKPSDIRGRVQKLKPN